MILGGFVALIVVAAATPWLVAGDALGGRVDGVRLARVGRSPQWRDGVFRNRRPRVDGPFREALTAWLFGGSDYRAPNAPIPVVARTGADYRTPPASGLRVTWFGHSTVLLEIDGRRVLLDPMWGDRASPFSFAGPKRSSRRRFRSPKSPRSTSC